MCFLTYILFFFFKQKTAYELRISDWSSDVCSSDLSYSKKSDKSQSDPSKMSVKFHGCHGHHVGIPVASAPEIERIAPVRVVLLRNRAGLAPPTRSDTFRPPIA